jgi:glycosyltransferase involved in cell wall biosynthesis
MRIAISDGGIGDKVGGSGRYLDLLVRGLREIGLDPSIIRMVDDVVSPTWLRRGKLACLASLGLPSLTRLTSGLAIDLAHSVENVVVPRRSGVPLVVTVHDTAALVEPTLVSSRLRLLVNLSWKRSTSWDALIVPSQATLHAIVELGIPPERVHLIRHAVGDAFTREPDDAIRDRVQALVSQKPYLAVVSPVSKKKGSDRLLEAWGRASRRMTGVLVWVTPGRSPRMDTPLPGIRWVSGVDDRLLAGIYDGAIALVSPSRWEGYGFPVAEALSMGVPVLASDIAPHREFDSPCLRFFQSDSAIALADAMVAVAESPPPRTPTPFPTSIDCARAHLAVYEKVAR